MLHRGTHALYKQSDPRRLVGSTGRAVRCERYTCTGNRKSPAAGTVLSRRWLKLWSSARCPRGSGPCFTCSHRTSHLFREWRMSLITCSRWVPPHFLWLLEISDDLLSWPEITSSLSSGGGEKGQSKVVKSHNCWSWERSCLHLFC